MARSARSKFPADSLQGRIPRVGLSQLTQLTSGEIGTVYRLMAEAKKGVARIPVPPRKQAKAEDSERKDAGRPEKPPIETESRGMHMLMSGAAQGKRDP